jgi:hypothetical protein
MRTVTHVLEREKKKKRGKEGSLDCAKIGTEESGKTATE